MEGVKVGSGVDARAHFNSFHGDTDDRSTDDVETFNEPGADGLVIYPTTN